MARSTRHFIPEIPCHIIIRGNNRQPCFQSSQDCAIFLKSLAIACREYQVSVHGYVLMHNHIHILATPIHSDSIGRAVQSLGSRYVQYFNKKYNRSGTLWEGRYKSYLVDTEMYFLECQRYIELNPVRARIVEHPKSYNWSSYHINAGLKPRKELVPHRVYLALGSSDEERAKNYRSLFDSPIARETEKALREGRTYREKKGSESFEKLSDPL